MNCSPTLTAEEFKNVHNGLCELNSALDRLQGVLSNDLYNRLVKAKEQITVGLVGAYAQDNNAFELKSDHYEKVQQDLGLDAIWSMFEVENLNDSHPFEGAKTMVYTEHWGKKPVRVPINGLTWAALYVAANAAIRDSGDDHHIFIEHFTQNGDELILSTGS